MHPYSLRRLSWAGPSATMIAILADGLYYAITKALGVQYLMPLDGSGSRIEPMPILMPILATLVTGLLATILFGLLVRFSRKARTIFLSVAFTALILSLGGPFNLPAASMLTKILLSGMQIIAAGIITGGILLMSKEGK
jgi:hypothetical protein